MAKEKFTHSNCLTSKKDGGIFSIYVDHYEADEKNILINAQAWESIFKPIYNIVGYSKFDDFAFMLTDNTFLKNADKKTRQPSFLSNYNNASGYMLDIQTQLFIIAIQKSGDQYRPVIEEKEYYRLSKNGINAMVEFAHNLAKDVAVNTSPNNELFERKEIKEWMVDAKANYDRSTVSTFFGQNRKLQELVHQAHEKRYPKLSS